MLEKTEILIVIFLLLLAFYVVISLGARNNMKTTQPIEIRKYLFGVRILIIIIGLVSLILWLFL